MKTRFSSVLLVLALVFQSGAVSALGLFDGTGAKAFNTPGALIQVCDRFSSTQQKIEECNHRVEVTLSALLDEGFTVLNSTECKIAAEAMPCEENPAMSISSAVGTVSFIR